MIFRSDRLLRRYSTFFAFLLAIQAALLPIYGPWLDHHFAERQAKHKHIYLGRVDLNHHDGEDSDVVSLPDLDAAGQVVGHLIPPYSQPPSNPLWGYDGLTFTILQDYQLSQGAIPPPPETPPRI